jgi:hypothetical protein
MLCPSTIRYRARSGTIKNYRMLEESSEKSYPAAAAVFLDFDLGASRRVDLAVCRLRLTYALRRRRFVRTLSCCPMRSLYRWKRAGAQRDFEPGADN